MYPSESQRAERPRARRAGFASALPVALSLALSLGCSDAGEPASDARESDANDGRPNVLFVVWDTTRSDRMSLYGHERETTPALDRWAKDAVVFDDVVSAAAYTVPSHASMFTGLLPSEHCAGGEAAVLAEGHHTLAELLRDAGYATFLYSENPHLAVRNHFAQGFDRVEHPWSEKHVDRAIEIAQSKVAGDTSSELADRLAGRGGRQRGVSPWNVKAAGELGEDAVLAFLDEKDPAAPYFVLVNYMEAHRPYIPPRRFRERFLSPGDVAASYEVDRSWDAIWEYTFGLREFSERDLELTRATYDAAIAELDELFASLLAKLDERGQLDDTIVVLTSDHGEHLGEQHMFDHQSSLYEAVLRVPLVIHHPKRIGSGRRSDPVMNFDVFPTLLALTGTPAPEGLALRSRDLFAKAAGGPDANERARLAEETTAESTGVKAMKRLHPWWDAAPWIRTQRALYSGRYKWISFSHGDPEMYDVRSDPLEEHDVAAMREIDAAQMASALASAEEGLGTCDLAAAPELDDEERARLQMLGYLPEDADPASEASEEPR